MIESSQKPENPEIDTQKEFKNIWHRFSTFIKDLLDISQGADAKATIEGIKKDIPFKGHTAWILIFSIFIASIGLNTNSTAVVIGAMLISPLMGPILGIGLSIGINDIDTLKRSLTNFTVMVFLSVLTAFVYFKISPFQTASNEILARIEPTLLDVLIAFFGGLAGIVAGSRKEKSNAIPGVAIATALMPPLCTAGFGLATGNLEYFLGALYLFGINTIFIAFSTFIVVKYLKFPLAKYAVASRRKKVNRIVVIVALLMIIPSIFSFIKIIDRTLYEKEVNSFVSKNVNYKGTIIVKQQLDIEKKQVNVYCIGNNIPDIEINDWKNKLNNNPKLNGTNLIIHQGKDQSNEIETKLSNKLKADVLQDLYSKNEKQLISKNEKIAFLEQEINRLSVVKIPLNEIANEAKINYPNMEALSYANVISTNFKNMDTIPIFTVSWNKKLKSKEQLKQEEKLYKWLQFKLKLDTLSVKSN